MVIVKNNRPCRLQLNVALKLIANIQCEMIIKYLYVLLEVKLLKIFIKMLINRMRLKKKKKKMAKRLRCLGDFNAFSFVTELDFFFNLHQTK